MTDIGFALLGCGRISRKHIDAVRETTGARLVAVCDILPDRARSHGEKLGVPHYVDLDEMLARQQDIQVVNVLTPSGLHAQHCITIAQAGRHVVVEKPMALRLDDADRMIAACARAGVRLFVVKQNRYNPPVQALRRALESGRLGKLVMGTVRVRWSRDQAYYDQDAWRGTWALDGGVLANQASHHIDLLEWMMGDVDSVFAHTATQLVNIEAEDTAVVLLKFANGALGVIEATTATRPKDLEGSLSVLGSDGSVVIGGFAVNELVTWEFRHRLPEDANVIESTLTRPDNVYGFGHKAVIAHTVDCIKTGRPALVDGLEGRKSLELITAIYESAESGVEVNVRFKPKLSRLGS